MLFAESGDMRSKSGAFKALSFRKRGSVKESDLLVVNECISKIRKLRPHADSRSVDASVVSERKSCGYRIVDLQLDRFMQALRFVLVHYCPKYSLLRIKDRLIGNALLFCRFDRGARKFSPDRNNPIVERYLRF